MHIEERISQLEAEVSALKSVNSAIVSNQFKQTEWIEMLDALLNKLIEKYQNESIDDEIHTAISYIQDGLDQLKHLFSKE